MQDTDLVAAGRFSVFAHLQAEKGRLYRAVLAFFRSERERFMIALRPAEVHRAIVATDRFHPSPSVEEINAALDQLVAWNNLEASRDTADVTTVEDFYRQRLVYQFSIAGEAAEHALQAFAQHLAETGELRATALRDIIRLLRGLDELLHADSPDAAKLHEVMRNLTDRLEELTRRAQSFLRSLHAPAELHGFALERFLQYKDALIEYLQRFIGELVVCTNQIAAQLGEIDEVRLDAALAAVADHELVDAFAPTDEDRRAAALRWHARWAGLVRWFRAAAGEASQAELLRARARSAIPALLATIANLNDRRARRTDRAADFHTLALWFATAPSDGDLHRLWRASFGLASTRHLRTNDETLAAADARGDSHRVAWRDAAPMVVTPRLRRTGRLHRRGAPAAVIDRAEAKAYLARLAAKEAAEIERARATLASGNTLRLAQLGELDDGTFQLFLDLLGDALARKTSPSETVDASSADGILHLRLEPIPGGTTATLRTEHGTFSGPDHFITITRLDGDDRAPMSAS